VHCRSIYHSGRTHLTPLSPLFPDIHSPAICTFSLPTQHPIPNPPKSTSTNLSKCQKTTTAKVTHTNPPAQTPPEITTVPVTTGPVRRTTIHFIIAIRMGVIITLMPMGVHIIIPGMGMLGIRLLAMGPLEGQVGVVGIRGRVSEWYE